MPKRKKAKGNEIGSKENRKFRDQALSMLDVLTAEREKEGYIWVRQGQTTKQIHPEKLQKHLEEGWKKIGKNG